MPFTVNNEASPAPAPPRPWPAAMARGFWRRCPACGIGRLFTGFIAVNDACPHCGEELHHQRADDAPPYFTIFIVAHIIITLVLIVEKLWRPAFFVHALLWIPAIFILTLLLMPAVKGAIIGLQWALRMHGFGERLEE